MNRVVENAVVGKREGSRGIVSRAADRVQSWFRHPYLEQSSRDLDLRLEQSLSGIRDEFTPAGGARFRIFVKGQSKPLNPEVQEQIYLIGREALVNALRHSKATDIEAEVEYLPRLVRVVVRDNGCGIDPQVVRPGRNAHWGLLGMRERAGRISAQLRIWSRPGVGTEVEISVPGQAAAAACA